MVGVAETAAPPIVKVMKFMKIVLAFIGVAGLVAAGILLALNSVDLLRLTDVANANNSQSPFANPFERVALTSGLAAAGGLLLGLGLGMPGKTRGQIRNEALDSAAAKRQSEIQNRAAGEIKG